MENKENILSDEELIELFENKNIIINDKNLAITKLKTIGYYRLKTFAKPFETIDNSGNVVYEEKTKFDDIVKRYYQDKNLRIFVLHAIEKIEVSLKNIVSQVLAKNFGYYGYLNFNNWQKRNASNKNFKYEQLQEQSNFKKSILKQQKRDNFYKFSTNNVNDEGLPNVWIGINLLTFGDVVRIVSTMKKSCLREISSFYNCTTRELISWLKCLNLIRNICCHNSNLIDLKLISKPIIRNEWKKFLKTDENNQICDYSGAVIICVVMYLVNEINPKYKWGDKRKKFNGIIPTVMNICSNEDLAKRFGFKNKNSIYELINCIKRKRRVC